MHRLPLPTRTNTAHCHCLPAQESLRSILSVGKELHQSSLFCFISPDHHHGHRAQIEQACSLFSTTSLTHDRDRQEQPLTAQNWNDRWTANIPHHGDGLERVRLEQVKASRYHSRQAPQGSKRETSIIIRMDSNESRRLALTADKPHKAQKGKNP